MLSNEKSLNKKRRTVFKTWIFSYMFILLVVIFLVVVMGYLHTNLLVKEIANSKRTELSVFQENMEYTTDECRRSALSLATTEDIKTICADDFDVWDNHLKLKSIMRSLRSQMPSIDEFYIYLKDKDVVISSIGYTEEPYDFYNSYYGNSDMDYKKWYDEVLDCRTAGYTYLKEQDENGKAEVMSICYSLPLGFFNRTEGTIVAVINSKRYARNIERLKVNGDISVLVYDDNYTLNYSYGKYIPTKLQLMKAEESGAFLKEKILGENVVISSMQSVNTKWWYVVIVPYKNFWKNLIFVRWMNFIIIALLMILGAAGVYFVTQYNYKALSQIVFRIKSKIDAAEATDTYDEYELINHMVDASEQLYGDLERQKENLLAAKLSNLLLGIGDNDAKADLYYELDGVFCSKYFITGVFEANAYTQLFEEEEISAGERFSTMLFIINNVVSELLEPYGSINFVESGNIIFLFSPEEKYADEAEAIVMREVSKALEIVNEHFHLQLECGIGKLCEGLQNICIAYIEASKALNFKPFSGDGGVYIYNVAMNQDKSVYYSMEQEQHLISLIVNGDYENAAKQIEWIIEVNAAKNESEQMLRALVIELGGTVLKAAMNVGCNIDSEHLMSIAFNSDISFTKTALSGVVKDVCDFVQGKEKAKDDIWVDKVNTLIEENYEDEALTVSKMAVSFGLNPNYLSAIYKKKTNQNILYMIQKRRIKAAIQLLVTTNIPIEKIARQVGFGSMTAFNRIFKKHTGMSAGKYREIYSQ